MAKAEIRVHVWCFRPALWFLRGLVEVGLLDRWKAADIAEGFIWTKVERGKWERGVGHG